MKKNMSFIIVIIVVAIPLIYLGIIYHSLPAIVATHFGVDGKPDGFSSKATLIPIIAFLMALTIGIYLLITNISKIDPKKSAQLSKGAMQKIAFGIVALMTVIAVIIVYSSIHNSFSLEKILMPMLGLFFAYLGNLMHSIKPNYFVGIRTPWALEDEDNWRKTHQLAGKLWFAGGILIAIAALILQAEFTIYLMVSVTIVITLIPAIYSYRYFKTHKHFSN